MKVNIDSGGKPNGGAETLSVLDKSLPLMPGMTTSVIKGPTEPLSLCKSDCPAGNSHFEPWNASIETSEYTRAIPRFKLMIPTHPTFGCSPNEGVIQRLQGWCHDKQRIS